MGDRLLRFFKGRRGSERCRAQVLQNVSRAAGKPSVGASLLAKNVNDNAGHLDARGVPRFSRASTACYCSLGFNRASNSATFASRLSSRARVRARTTIWLSNSSRLTKSSLLNPLCSSALNWLSISLRGSGVSPLNRREAWPLRASRRSLGASMGNIPENSWPAVYHAAPIVFSKCSAHAFRALARMRMHCFCAYPGCRTGPLVGVSGQRIDFSDFYGAGKVSA